MVRLLSREGQLRQEDIVLRLVLDKGSVARSVARLEEAAWRYASQQPVPPGKAGVAVTGGRENGGTDPVILDDWRRICLQGFFTPEERVQYETFLTRIMENVKEFKEGENTNG